MERNSKEVVVIQNDGRLAINDGIAIGNSSIAAGIADKEVLEGIVGQNIPGTVKAPTANDHLTLALGIDTVADTVGAMAMGVANIAGARGYYWHSIDFTNKKITLSTSRKDRTSSSATAPADNDPKWVVGDYISIRNKDRGYGYCSKITAVNGNVITVDSLPFTKDLYTSVLGFISYEAPYDRTIYAVYQENYLGQSKVKRWRCRGGTVDLGVGALATGMQNGATGIFSEVSGRGNLAAGDYSHSEGRVTIASGEASHTEGQRTIAMGYASHAEGTADTSANEYVVASGDGSHAEGYGGAATGHYAHKEGHKSTASGGASHAEGDQSQATEWAAHAEGQETEASALYSHSEGFKTYATKVASHAEGARTIADGGASHAEGADTIAFGERSHAEGEGTIAAGNYQHVQGKYNVEDRSGKYAHIVGWGSDKSNRKNIHTLDTNGNAWFAGTLMAKGVYSNEPAVVATHLDIYPLEENINSLYDIKADESSLATVATTGKHSDLVDTPPLEKGTGENSLKQTGAKEALGENSFTMGQGTVAVNANEVVLGEYNIPTVSSHTNDRVYVGEWKPNTDYINRYHCVVHEGKYYLCKSNHNSGTSFDATKWILFAGTTRSKNLLTIGNGSSDTDRSNAATIDINGNAWFAGDITLGEDTTGLLARIKALEERLAALESMLTNLG